jgi:hypothetical protein
LYDEVFIIDEKHRTIHRSSRADLLALESRSVAAACYTNLVAVGKTEHLAAIEHFMANHEGEMGAKPTGLSSRQSR